MVDIRLIAFSAFIKVIKWKTMELSTSLTSVETEAIMLHKTKNIIIQESLVRVKQTTTLKTFTSDLSQIRCSLHLKERTSLIHQMKKAFIFKIRTNNSLNPNGEGL